MEDIRLIIMDIAKKKGWNQKETAKRAKVSEATMSGIAKLKTEPDSITLQKFATAFNMKLTELYDYKIGETQTTDETDTHRKQLIEWALKPENQAYVELARTISKDVPANLLGRLEFTFKINTGGGNTNE